jgi:hypothetical protein
VNEVNLNPYAGLTYAELCGRRKDYARLKDTGVAVRKEAERHLSLIGAAMEDCRPSRGIEVSDHAVIRFLERVRGVDVNAIRTEIADEVRRGTQIASERIRGGRLKEIYVVNGAGHVTTVLPAEALIASISKGKREGGQ